ncbi:MAG: VWA domain-containing protein [bacterium]|nr:VWA domain-containing protein [bacterium]
MNKRGLLVLSVLFSLAVHALFLLVAPYMSVMREVPAPPEPKERFQVRVIDDTMPLVEMDPAPTEGQVTALRPGEVEDLLNREMEELSTPESLLEESVDVANIEDRLANENLEREHDLQPDEDNLKMVDARIIEISSDVAREDIQIARRHVAPSSDRILNENEFPVLRGGSSDVPEEALLIDPMPVRRVKAVSGGGAEAMPEQNEGTPGGTSEETEEPDLGLPELPPESLVARRQVQEDIRKDSPYQFIDDLVDIELETFMPPDDKQGYFRLSIVPKKGKDIPALPKDVTFIMDASSSILQRKLDRTANAVREMVTDLRPEDRFNVVVFRDSPTRFQPGLVAATPDNKTAATQFLKGLESRGETDVYTAIRPVVLSDQREGVPNIVMVMTDGRPTTGIRDARTIINTLTEENDLRKSIFAFGGGRTVNRYMLDLLAYRNKGESFFSPKLDEIDAELPDFFSKLADPILVDCMAEYGRLDRDNVFPKEIPDFYKGQAVTVYGRFDPESNEEFAMRLRGVAVKAPKEVVFKAGFKGANTGNAQIARDWAFRRIYSIIGEMCRVGETPELLAELRALSQKYDIKTSYDD